MVSSSMEAELLNLLWAVESSYNLRQEHLIFETSSQGVVDAIQKSQCYPRFRLIINEIKSYLLNFASWEVIFIHRHLNQPASRLREL